MLLATEPQHRAEKERAEMTSGKIFWIVGVVINVGLTGLAIWWILKQMRKQ
ncbi:MAG: hypothetical protein H7836_00110 [Magnetococcus sp. YQC-3]